MSVIDSPTSSFSGSSDDESEFEDLTAIDRKTIIPGISQNHLNSLESTSLEIYESENKNSDKKIFSSADKKLDIKEEEFNSDESFCSEDLFEEDLFGFSEEEVEGEDKKQINQIEFQNKKLSSGFVNNKIEQKKNTNVNDEVIEYIDDEDSPNLSSSFNNNEIREEQDDGDDDLNTNIWSPGDDGVTAPTKHHEMCELPRIPFEREKFLVEIPNSLLVEPCPFDSEIFSTLDPDTVEQADLRMAVEDTMRWRFVLNEVEENKNTKSEIGDVNGSEDSIGMKNDNPNSLKEKSTKLGTQANTQLVIWDDGRLSILVGDELFDAMRVPVPAGTVAVFAVNQDHNILSGECSITEKLMLQPCDVSNRAHQKMADMLSRKFKRTQCTKIVNIDKDPEISRLERIKEEQDCARALRNNDSSRKRNQQKNNSDHPIKSSRIFQSNNSKYCDSDQSESEIDESDGKENVDISDNENLEDDLSEEVSSPSNKNEKKSRKRKGLDTEFSLGRKEGEKNIFGKNIQSLNQLEQEDRQRTQRLLASRKNPISSITVPKFYDDEESENDDIAESHQKISSNVSHKRLGKSKNRRVQSDDEFQDLDEDD